MSVQSRADNADPVAAASYWYSRKRAGDMNVDELRALEVWLRASNSHQRSFENLEKMWLMASAIEDDPAIMEACEADIIASRILRRPKAIAVIAVSLIVATGGGWTLWRTQLLPEMAWWKAPPAQEFRTSIGQRSTITLTDGSIVTLDTDTLLHASVSGRERRISLDHGRAYFQVAKDRTRPFIVAAGGKTVRATGTAFDVRVEPGQLQVTLIEGRVLVQERGADRGDGPVADMRPGWRLAIGDDMRWRMEPIDLAKATSWREGNLVFFFDSLVSAAAEMNRYSERKIVFEGEAPTRPIVGNFQAGDVDSFIRAVKLNKLARVVSETESEVKLAAP